VDISIIDLFQKQTFHEQAALIEEQRDKAGAALKKTIPKLPKTPHYPMSHAQQRLLFLHQLDPQNTSYNLPTALRFQENLDVEKFKNALQTVVQRQASLRTTFAMIENKPVQLVAEDIALETWFKIEDFSQLQEAEQTRFLAQRMEQEAHFPFDLTKAPLFYAIIFKLAPRDCILFFNMHHIIGDLWSWEIFFKELISLYQSGIEEKEASLPVLPIQYADYAAWQNQCIEDGDFQKHEEYWLNQLSGEIPVLQLPLDFPRPITQSYSGGSVNKTISQTSMESLFQLFQEKRVTLFIGFLALFYAFLYKITGQEDIIIGTPEAGRNQVELENLVGFFINTIPLRVNLQGNPTFSEVIDRVKQVSLAAYDHAEYPLNLLINKVNPERDRSRYPLFSVMLQFIDEEEAGESASLGASMNMYDVPTNTTNYDLEVFCTRTSRGLQCTFLYCRDLFLEETMQRWLDYFITFIETASTSPGRRISATSLVSREEKHKLLMAVNGPVVDFPKDQTIQSLFENQVQRTPDQVALVGPGLHITNQEEYDVADVPEAYNISLTYKELDRKANQLAQILKEKAIGIAGILMERSVEMIIGVLAILKAGGAYLPIEPNNPRGRINYLLSDSNAKILVTSREWAEKGIIDCPTLIVNGESLEGIPEGPRFKSTSGTPLTYVIYTSGTTGVPKGVLIKNRNLVNYVSWVSRVIALTPADRSILTSSFAFDLGYTSVYSALLTGCTLHLIRSGILLTPPRLLDYIEKQGITYLKVTPSLLGMMVNNSHFSSSTFKALRCILIGGEPINTDDVDRVYRLCKHLRIMNHYGPSETTIGSIARFIDFADFQSYQARPTIGKPIDNTRVYILDRDLYLAPPCIPGELYIGPS
jgi:amino acid adenylation domain-containing protein